MALLSHAGRSIVLERSIVTIGTAVECDVVVASPHCSRKHALVLRDRDGWLLVDFRSANGVAVNGRPIELERLRDGDVITLSGATGAAQVRLEFRSGASPSTSPPARAAPPRPAPARALARVSHALAIHAAREDLVHAVLDALIDLTAADRAALAFSGPFRIEDRRPFGGGSWRLARERTPAGIEPSRWEIWAPAAHVVCAGTPVVYSADCLSDRRFDSGPGGDRNARAIPMFGAGVWASLEAMGQRYGILQLDTRIGARPLPAFAEDVVKAIRGPLALGLAALCEREAA